MSRLLYQASLTLRSISSKTSSDTVPDFMMHSTKQICENQPGLRRRKAVAFSM